MKRCGFSAITGSLLGVKMKVLTNVVRLPECFQVPQFKAQPLPDFNTVVLPEKKKLEPTKTEPFRLLIDQRGAVKNSRREQMVRHDLPHQLLLSSIAFVKGSYSHLCVLQMKEEQKQHEEAATFKARPNTVTHKEPFRPKKENRAAVGKTITERTLVIMQLIC